MAVKYAANPGELSTSIDNVDLTAAFGAGSEFALFIPSQGVPYITWQTVINGTITSITVLLEASLDGTNWFTVDQSTNITGEVRTVTGAFRFIRINNSAVVGGAGDELTASFVQSNLVSASQLALDGPAQHFRKKVSLTEAQIYTLFSVPVVLLPALGSGGMTMIDRILGVRQTGLAYTGATGNLQFRLGTVTTWFAFTLAQTLGSTGGNAVSMTHPTFNTQDATANSLLAWQVQFQTANPTAASGTNGYDLDIYYSVWPLTIPA